MTRTHERYSATPAHVLVPSSSTPAAGELSLTDVIVHRFDGAAFTTLPCHQRNTVIFKIHGHGTKDFDQNNNSNNNIIITILFVHKNVTSNSAVSGEQYIQGSIRYLTAALNLNTSTI